MVTDFGNVKVLGTQFNVFSRDGILDVKCFEGSVAVLSGGEVLSTLTANQAVRIEKGKLKNNWNVTENNNWTNGVFQFTKVPLKRVINALERQFEIDIKVDGIDLEEELSCNFENKDLETALKTALGPFGFQYEIKNDTTVILSKK